MTAPPKPPRVADIELHWTTPPPTPSPRLVHWLGQIREGWRPNRRISAMGYYAAARWYGVYVWEYLHAITPALHGESWALADSRGA